MFLSRYLLVYIKWKLDVPICANVVQAVSYLLYLSSLFLWFLWGHFFNTTSLEYHLKSWHSCRHSCGFFSFTWKLIIHTSSNPARCVLASLLVVLWYHCLFTHWTFVMTSLWMIPCNFHCVFWGLYMAFIATHFKKGSNRYHKGRNSPAYS